MKQNIKQWICRTAAVLAVASSAQAVSTGATMFLWDNTGDTKTISDNGAGDGSALDGAVVYVGALGANWTFIVDAGTSKPTDGSATHPLMDLSFNHLASSGSGTLTVAFFDNAFGPTGLLGAIASIGGTFNAAGMTLTYKTYTEGNNTTPGFVGGALDLTGFTQLTSQTFNSDNGTAFSGVSTAGNISGGANPFSLLQVITITTRGAGQVTGDGSLKAPDGGMTLMLLGSSLTALGLLRRSFKKN